MSKYSDLSVRALTALGGAIVMIFCLLFNEWTFFGLFLFIMISCLVEFGRLVELPKLQGVWQVVVGIIIYSLVFLVVGEFVQAKWLFILVPMLSISLGIELYLKDEQPLRSMALFYLGIGYIVIPFSLLSPIIFHSGGFSPFLLFGLVIIIWCMDVGAYFFGIAFGKHKLFEKVSPKKSWEGAFGGVTLALTGAWVLSRFLDQLEPWQWMMSGLLIAVVGIFGDLVESFMKRISQVKDSGNSIPGHGGFLDRFDSLIYSIPFFLLLLKLI